jgi:hypothetical protein
MLYTSAVSEQVSITEGRIYDFDFYFARCSVSVFFVFMFGFLLFFLLAYVNTHKPVLSYQFACRLLSAAS